jgi:uncharacterized protein
MAIVGMTVLLVAAAIWLSFSGDSAVSAMMWLTLVAPYAVLSGFTLYKLRDDGTLRERLAFRWGDFTVGVLMGGLLVGAAWAVRYFLIPSGSPQVSWLFRVLLQVGNVQRLPILTFAIVLLALMEELVWRGLVLDELTQKLGTRRAWPAAAVAYALAHLPSAYSLRDPIAGPNPLLVVAALGCGLVWSFAASRSGRLPPVMISHVTFTYFAPAIVLSPP